jgi:hypothetical protein
MIKRVFFVLLIASLPIIAFASTVGGANDGKDIVLGKGEILIVVIDQSGEENYTKVKLTDPGVAEMVAENNEPISAKLPVYLFEDKLQRLNAGFYLVIAASEDALRNRLVYIR